MTSPKYWSDGFTLIEVLVALTLISIAILSAVGVFSTISLMRGRGRTLARISADINSFLTIAQSDGSWTNWQEGTVQTNSGATPLELSVRWYSGEREQCEVVVRGFYRGGQRTNVYTVSTRFSRAYDEAF